MESRKLIFDNGRGESLAARLDLPADDRPIAYAVFAHCFTCSKNLRAVSNISRALVSRGIGVLRFDFTGLGDSEGDFADTTFSANADDLVAASRMLAARYSAPSILVGHSLGGAAVLRAADQIPSAKAVATIGAPFDPNHVAHLFEESLEEIKGEGSATVTLAGRPFLIRRQFIHDLMSQDPKGYISNLGRAIAIFHSPRDETVGVRNAALIFEAARHPKSFISLDGADHLLTDEADSVYAGLVIAAWAARYIGSPQEDLKHPDPADNHVSVRIGRTGLRTEILANGHSLTADEPRSVGGTNAGATPYDLLVAGLGACTAMTLRLYADRRQWPLEGVTVRLRHSKVHAKDCDHETTETGQLDYIDRRISLEGDLTEEQRKRLIDIAGQCPVHRTLEHKVIVRTSEAAL